MNNPSLDFGLWIFFGGEWGGIGGKLFACFFFAWFLSVTGNFRANSHRALPPVWKPNSKLVALTAGSDPGPDGGTGVTSVVMTKQLLPLVCCKGSWGPQLCCAVTIS